MQGSLTGDAVVCRACKAVVAAHRLILSGTPVPEQHRGAVGPVRLAHAPASWAPRKCSRCTFPHCNRRDVLDIGYVPHKHPADHACKHLKKMLCGQARHGRAMQAARTSKRGSREAEAALLSLDALHKQVPALAGNAPHLLCHAMSLHCAHISCVQHHCPHWSDDIKPLSQCMPSADQAICAAAHQGPGAVRPAAKGHPGRLCGAISAAGMGFMTCKSHLANAANFSSCNESQMHTTSLQAMTIIVVACCVADAVTGRPEWLGDVSANCRSAGRRRAPATSAQLPTPHRTSSRHANCLNCRFHPPHCCLSVAVPELEMGGQTLIGSCHIAVQALQYMAQGVQPPGAGAGAGQRGACGGAGGGRRRGPSCRCGAPSTRPSWPRCGTCWRSAASGTPQQVAAPCFTM